MLQWPPRSVEKSDTADAFVAGSNKANVTNRSVDVLRNLMGLMGLIRSKNTDERTKMPIQLPKLNFADPNSALGGAHLIEQEQSLDLPRDEVFKFFSDARNLEKLTPPWLNFKIVEIPEQLTAGALIRYRLKLRGLPIHWTTRIEEWSPNDRFVDIQIAGPYALWHHTHEFEDLPDGGTLIRDTVRYRVPFGPVGEPVRRLLVAPDTRKIFDYRREAIDRYLLGATRPPSTPAS